MTRKQLHEVVGALAAAITLSLVSSTVTAQANGVEGPGFRVGNLEIHPSLATRGGYDSNVFKRDGKFGRKIIDGASINVTPSLTLGTLGRVRKRGGEDAAGSEEPPPPKLEFRAGLSGTYFHYFLLSNTTKGSESVDNFDATADAALHILPRRTVNLEIDASYTRSARPFTEPTGGKTKNAYSFDQIQPGVRVNFETRGQVFTAYTGFRPIFQPYEDKTFKYLSYNSYDLDAGSAWKFLPHTALVYDLDLQFVDYYKYDAGAASKAAADARAQANAGTPIAAANGTPNVLLSNSTRLATRIGINGAFTEQWSVRALIGYGTSLLKDKRLDEYQTPIGEAAVTYRFGANQTSSAELGFNRNASLSSIGSYMLLDRGYGRMGFLVARRLDVGAELGVGYATYGKQLRPDGTALGYKGTSKRTDVRVDATIRSEYRLTSWLGLVASASAFAVLTDFQYDTLIVTQPPDPAKFKTFQAYAGLRASY